MGAAQKVRPRARPHSIHTASPAEARRVSGCPSRSGEEEPSVDFATEWTQTVGAADPKAAASLSVSLRTKGSSVFRSLKGSMMRTTCRWYLSKGRKYFKTEGNSRVGKCILVTEMKSSSKGPKRAREIGGDPTCSHRAF